jgi:peptide/nickel transport system substrate-binding protein
MIVGVANARLRSARVTLAGIALLLVLAVGANDTRAASDLAGARAGSTVSVRLPLDYPSLDPMVDGSNSIGWAAISPGYDKLVSVKKNGNGFGPYLARSWIQKPRSISFQLRTDARCTDGHVLTAVDMLNSIKRFIFVQKRSGSPASNSAGSWGPGPYHLRANNKRATLVLSVDKPYRNLLGLFAGLPVICPAGLQALQSDPRALENRVYGSGPYTLVSAQHNNEIRWRLRTNWRWGPPGTSTRLMPETVVYKVVVDPTTAANLLLTGGLDVVTLTGPDVNRLLSNTSLRYVKAANWHVSNLNFNMLPGRPFALGEGDALREAISLAIDPKRFNTVVFSGRGHVTPTGFRTNAECYDKASAKLRPAPNLAQARQVLTRAGYTLVNGKLSKGGRPLGKIGLVSSVAFFPNGGAYILSVLEQLGFDIQLSDLGATYGPTIIGGNFDLTLQFANRPSPEPGQNVNTMVGPAPPNGSNIGGAGQGDPSWTRYYNAALQNVGAGSCRYFALFQQLALKNHYSLPLASPNYDIFSRKSSVASLPNWPPDVFGFPWFYVAVT